MMGCLRPCSRPSEQVYSRVVTPAYGAQEPGVPERIWGCRTPSSPTSPLASAYKLV